MSDLDVRAALQEIKIKYERGDAARKEEIKSELEYILKLAEKLKAEKGD